VISGRNEAGKSTLVEALRAALFERHDAGNRKIRALQTHGTRNAPEVWVELDIGGERVSVHKRFLSSPLAEVRLHAGGAVLLGAEAEDRLLARLDGRRPSRSGSTRNDMGLWGLLWVAQDETAYTDPGSTLDGDVRGALSDVISRQVGHVLGGKHGERLRSQVAEHCARYFTGHGAKTGAYRSAEERLQASIARVKKIEQTKAEVEDLAAEHRELWERLREAEEALSGLEREYADAVSAEQQGEKLESISREAEARVASAKAEAQAAQQEADARASLTREISAIEAEIKKSEGTASALTKACEHAKSRADIALLAADQARAADLAARAALDTATRDLDRARQRDEAARAAKDLRAAEDVARAVADAERRLEAETVDEHALKLLEGLAAKSKALRSRLDAEGTRIVVFPSDGEPIVRSASGPATIDVPGIGALEVEPARPGLAQALSDAEKLRAKLEEALHALGVEDVASARARHATRSQTEREERGLQAQKKRLAPKGLEALEEEVRALQVKRARLESTLDEAARAERDREESSRELAANRFDEAAMEGLCRCERDVAVLRGARDAKGTRVEVLALTDLRVRTAGTKAPQTVFAGERFAFNSIEGTTLLLDEIAQVQIEPRGEDLATTRAELERAERDLAAALQTLGVATVEEATASARAWVRLDAVRKQAEERLADAAPGGLEELQADVERVRAQSLASEAALADAGRAFARHAQVEVELSQNRVTGEALDRISALDRDLRDAESAVKRRQARVRAVSGPVAAGFERAWEVTRRVRPDAVQGVAWEIIPGELSGELLDADGCELRLREALLRAGVADVDAAKARFRDRLMGEARLTELRKQLRGLAPDGLDALRSRAARLNEAVGVERSANMAGDAAAQIEALQMAVDERRERARALETAAERAAEAAEQAARGQRAQESAFREVEAARRERAVELRILSDKLAALRGSEPDEELYQRSLTARWAYDQALGRAKRVEAELEAASPERLRREVARAKGAIDAQRQRMTDLHDKALQRKALLDKAAVEGHFEELGEAQAEQFEAEEAFQQIDREARAADLLSKVVQEVYTESQRRFLEPVLKEASPYLRKLRPETEIRMSPDLKVDKVVRHGKEEDFGQLSGGTREQLAVIVRLALARVMARDKRPLPLILDDTLGWTDDGRFLSMVQILREAASDLQIILLTCHPARFYRFHPEYSVDLDRLRETSPAPEA
jgi:hypothetical protein